MTEAPHRLGKNRDETAPASSDLVGDRHVACAAFPLSATAVAVSVSALTSGLPAAAFAQAVGVPVPGADSLPVVGRSAFAAGASARGCAAAAPPAAAAFAVPVVACALTPHHECFAAGSAGSG